MEKFGDPLTLYIDGYLHDVHEAEDLMIEVFSYLFAKRPHIRDGGFRAYLYKAARHMALRHKSIRRHHFCLDDLTKEPEGDEDKNLEKYATTGSPEYEKMVSIIAERFGLTSLKFNTLETLIEAIGLPKCKVCTHCFDGSSHF